MPPELVLHGTVSRAVDVYSFGVLLWQMYTGSRPWSGLTHSQIIMMIGSGVSGWVRRVAGWALGGMRAKEAGGAFLYIGAIGHG
jgi:serine/threonine protein kinase